MAIASSGAALEHLQPRPVKDLFAGNYLAIGTDFDFQDQFLPEIYEKEIERFGNRSVSGFLRMVGAEMPMASDEVVWTEQGRIHVAVKNARLASGDAVANKITFIAETTGSAPLSAADQCALFSVGDTIILSKGTASTMKTTKAIVKTVNTTDIIAVPYLAANLSDAGAGSWDNGATTDDIAIIVYGSEYGKGSKEVGNTKDAKFTSYSNKPIILRDKYAVNGSDTAQIGWVEVTSENGANGYLWYLKSEHEARLRFEDQLEMAMIEGKKRLTHSL